MITAATVQQPGLGSEAMRLCKNQDVCVLAPNLHLPISPAESPTPDFIYEVFSKAPSLLLGDRSSRSGNIIGPCPQRKELWFRRNSLNSLFWAIP
jgi:hypothetical protein